VTVLESVRSLALFAMSVGCLFTVCGAPSAAERTGLDPVRLFPPFRWLIGAALPATPGLRFATQAAHARR
jgi:hypothetical protein